MPMRGETADDPGSATRDDELTMPHDICGERAGVAQRERQMRCCRAMQGRWNGEPRVTEAAALYCSPALLSASALHTAQPPRARNGHALRLQRWSRD